MSQARSPSLARCYGLARVARVWKISRASVYRSLTETPNTIARRRGPDKWSVGEIVAHLSDTEIALAWRVRQILGTNAIPVQAFDQNAWASTFDYAHRDPRASIELFRVLRAANVALLKSVPKKLWDNYGVHEERGNESITHMTRMMAGHDLNHLRQIEQILHGQPSAAPAS